MVGAGFVALESAGVLTGLNNGEVTVLVRSVPLRGLDRDVVGKVTDYMRAQGTKIVMGVTPQSIEKIVTDTKPDQFKVTYSNGESGVFDTVLAAVGRRSDTDGLNLESMGLEVNPKNGRLITTNEQTNIPHIYAVGDVVDVTLPDSTAVALLSGILLAKRLVNASTDAPVEYMDYKNVATAVFTPLELGFVGLSEDEAQAM